MVPAQSAGYLSSGVTRLQPNAGAGLEPARRPASITPRELVCNSTLLAPASATRIRYATVYPATGQRFVFASLAMGT